MTNNIPDKLDKIYTSFLDLMFHPNNPVDLLDQCVAADVMGYGTTMDEKIFGLKSLKDLAILQREQSPELKFKYEVTPVYRKMMDENRIAILVDEIEISLQIDGNDVVFNLRMSMVWELR